MRYYELTYLISPELSEEDAKAFQEKVVSLVNEGKGSISAQTSPQKRKLAYSIKKQNQAYLAVLVFQLDPDKLTEFEKKLKAENEILRYLLLIKPKPREIKAPRRFVSERAPSRPKEKKVELKEIEKKLEEILDESK